jgi:hypothetical protein
MTREASTMVGGEPMVLKAGLVSVNDNSSTSSLSLKPSSWRTSIRS